MAQGFIPQAVASLQFGHYQTLHWDGQPLINNALWITLILCTGGGVSVWHNGHGGGSVE